MNKLKAVERADVLRAGVTARYNRLRARFTDTVEYAEAASFLDGFLEELESDQWLGTQPLSYVIWLLRQDSGEAKDMSAACHLGDHYDQCGRPSCKCRCHVARGTEGLGVKGQEVPE